MRNILLIVCVICTLGCRQTSDVQCNCHGGGYGKEFDLGRHYNPSANQFQAQCDTMGTQNGTDTCWVNVLRD